MSAIYGVSELAAAVGVSPDAIRQRVQRAQVDWEMGLPGAIPQPSAVLRNGRVWQGEAIEEWIRRQGVRRQVVATGEVLHDDE